jgi:hypothetical protein
MEDGGWRMEGGGCGMKDGMKDEGRTLRDGGWGMKTVGTYPRAEI